MKAIIYHSYDDIRMEETPTPSCAEDELLISVHGCGLCGSDILKIVQQAPPPVRLGHEITGTIIECGRLVTDFSTGERVVVGHHVPCGTCHYCLHDNYSMCATFKSSNVDPCGLAECLRVPALHVQHTTLHLPDALSAEQGSFVEPVACCVRAASRTPLLDGDSVVVMGLGSIGLLMLQVLRSLANRSGHRIHIYGVDLLPERLHMALKLGADATFLAPQNHQELRQTLNEYTEGRGSDAVIITAPGAQPLLSALACVRKGGMLNIFAAHTGTVPINIETLYQQELTVSSTYSSSPTELPIALDMLANGEVLVDMLISHRLPLERFSEGVALMRERVALKVYFPISTYI